MEELLKLIENGDVEAVATLMKENKLELRVIDGVTKIIPCDEKKAWVKAQVGFWDQRQQARKILLNSLYGALLNEALRFSDERMGQSVTLTGRSIVRHMNAEVNNQLVQSYDYTGETICYADTDSCYFTAAGIVPAGVTREQFIELYDGVATAVNATFPDFMHKTFNTSRQRGAIIAAGRELVASKMLFIKKKKYGGLIYDLEGKRFDKDGKPGKLKAMGLDLKRADTPKFMQVFLESILMDILEGAQEDKIMQDIRDFRVAFKARPSWEKGSPKKVSNLTKYRSMIERSANMSLTDHRRKGEKGKNTIPGHVTASINWNNLCNHYRDKFSMRITDGSRIIVCKLRPNMLRMDSVAYPIDEPHLPEWFKSLPFDDALMENVIIDKKVSNLVNVLNWNLADSQLLSADEFFVFE